MTDRAALELAAVSRIHRAEADWLAVTSANRTKSEAAALTLIDAYVPPRAGISAGIVKRMARQTLKVYLSPAR